MFNNIYQKRPVFVTGHTGFKGSWFVTWLQKLGAIVSGYSLPCPSTLSHWNLLDLDITQVMGDIRNKELLSAALKKSQPEIVFHLAAQPLVKESYKNPLDTWSTNLMGTATLLEACRTVDSVKAIVIITTDKVYADRKWKRGYRESDTLGGHDPYSASKAACELLVESYRNAFYQTKGCLIATARSGNVIGGGDWAQDRLIPDLIRSITTHSPIAIRNPDAKRPWQHVLDCLRGYLILGQKLFEEEPDVAQSWNFGPSVKDCWPVIEILEFLQEIGLDIDWIIKSGDFVETSVLTLDSSQAYASLDWEPVWSLNRALIETAAWYTKWLEDSKIITHYQLDNFIEDAKQLNSDYETIQLSF